MDLPNLLLIDKPAGVTSFDVIRQLRRQHREAAGEKAPKLGHAGTLDPAATGLLLIGVGPGTKQLGDFLKLDKEYLAEVELGTRTASGDLDSPILEEAPVGELDEQYVESVVSALEGERELPVSAYSAIKKDGVPMYKRAHAAEAAGEEVAPVLRPMKIIEAAYLGMRKEGGKVVLTVRFSVGSGTYIRSLAEEIGRQLSLPATLRYLRRIQIGVFDVAHARVPSDYTELKITPMEY